MKVLERSKDELNTYGGAKIWFQRGYTPPNTEVPTPLAPHTPVEHSSTHLSLDVRSAWLRVASRT